jgi:hypothetical protein
MNDEGHRGDDKRTNEIGVSGFSTKEFDVPRF